MNDLTVYGKTTCVDTHRARALLDRLGVRYGFADVERSLEEREHARDLSGGGAVPVIAFPDGSHLVEPGDDTLTARLRELGIV